jgi:O-antigen/teichoic acid export membrane protein
MGALGLVALPVFARGLGAHRYGLLALNLAFINLAGVADLGVGRAAAKYIAEDYQQKETFRTQQFVSTALTVSVIMSLVGTALLCLLTPILVHFAFRIPAGMQVEAKMAFWITSTGLFGVLLRMALDGILAGHHQIAVLSLGNLISNTLRVLLSIAAILTGHALLAILTINVAMSYLHAAGLLWYARRHFAGRVAFSLGWNAGMARQLLKLGLVSTLSIILANGIFLYVDRFIIAALLPLVLTGYYTMAFDISARLAYVSNSVAATFFPVFSGHNANGRPELERSYLQATKAVAVGATGLAMLLIVFGRPLLTYWLDPSFAANSTSPLAILALAWLFSTYVQVLCTLILATAAQPGICVKVFAIAIVLHVAASLVFLRMWNIAGVAAAFALAYLFVFCCLLGWVGRTLVRTNILLVLRHCFLVPWASGIVLGFLLVFFVRPMVHNLVSVLAALAGGYLIYLGCCIMIAYDREERNYVRSLARNQFSSSWRKSLAFLSNEP